MFSWLTVFYIFFTHVLVFILLFLSLLCHCFKVMICMYVCYMLFNKYSDTQMCKRYGRFGSRMRVRSIVERCWSTAYPNNNNNNNNKRHLHRHQRHHSRISFTTTSSSSSSNSNRNPSLQPRAQRYCRTFPLRIRTLHTTLSTTASSTSVCTTARWTTTALPSSASAAYTGWAKKRGQRLVAVILSVLDRFKKSFSPKDSSVNLQLNGYQKSCHTLHMLLLTLWNINVSKTSH